MLKYHPQNYRFLCKEQIFIFSEKKRKICASFSQNISITEIAPLISYDQNIICFPLPEFGQFVSIHSFTEHKKKKKIMRILSVKVCDENQS